LKKLRGGKIKVTVQRAGPVTFHIIFDNSDTPWGREGRRDIKTKTAGLTIYSSKLCYKRVGSCRGGRLTRIEGAERGHNKGSRENGKKLDSTSFSGPHSRLRKNGKRNKRRKLGGERKGGGRNVR